ncbi:MAG TPA: flagellar protein FlaG [Spirochaetota bacterium]|nr:flagellar protein FlaG [Spirochaetota bacterium]
MNAMSIVENFNIKMINSGHIARNDKTVTEKQDAENFRREELSPEDIKRTVAELNRLSGSFNEKVQFGYHENTNRIVIKIIDKDTNEVVSEIPSKYSLRLLEHIQENIGLIVDESR